MDDQVVIYLPDTDEYRILGENGWTTLEKPTTSPANGYKWDYDTESGEWVQVELEPTNPDIFYDPEIMKYKISTDEGWVVIEGSLMPTEDPGIGYEWSYDLNEEKWIIVKSGTKRTDDELIKELNKEELYTYKGYEFSLKVVLKLNRDRSDNITSLSISSYIDNDQYGTTLTTAYDRINIEYYEYLAKSKIDILKSAVNRSPSGMEETYTIHKYIFTAEVVVTKEANSNVVKVQGVLDGQYLWTPATLTYNVNNMTVISNKIYEIFTQIKNRLVNLPVNYLEVYSVDYMNFLINVKYSKKENDKVVILLRLDNEDYETKKITFNIDNISAITTQSTNMVNLLKNKLATCPKIKSMEFTVRNFIFNIQQFHVKMPGFPLIRTYVMVDNIVRSDRKEHMFDIDKIDDFKSDNETMVNDILEKLTSLVPDNLRIVYTKNGTIYLIEVRFTKKKNSNVVVVNYYFNNGEQLYLDYMDSYYL